MRLATYEDKRESEFLAKVFRGASGQLENTVFALISPDCKSYLTPPDRSPHGQFRDAGDLADAMNWYADYYHVKSNSQGPTSLPFVRNYRLALNMAACEGLPLLVVSNDQWGRKLQEHSSDQSLLGLAVMVKDESLGHTVIDLPDEFGLKSEKRIVLDPELDLKGLKILLRAHQTGPKDMRTHMAEGHQKGIRWETAVPVTDPQAKY